VGLHNNPLKPEPYQTFVFPFLSILYYSLLCPLPRYPLKLHQRNINTYRKLVEPGPGPFGVNSVSLFFSPLRWEVNKRFECNQKKAQKRGVHLQNVVVTSDFQQGARSPRAWAMRHKFVFNPFCIHFLTAQYSVGLNREKQTARRRVLCVV
jgi:hypothetical protein